MVYKRFLRLEVSRVLFCNMMLKTFNEGPSIFKVVLIKVEKYFRAFRFVIKICK
jgi:hypothetical protein